MNAYMRKDLEIIRHIADEFRTWVRTCQSGTCPMSKRLMFRLLIAKHTHATSQMEEILNSYVQHIRDINDDPMTAHYGMGGEMSAPYYRFLQAAEFDYQMIHDLYTELVEDISGAKK